MRRALEVVVASLLIVTFVATTVGIEGSSMAPALRDGERALVPRFETWLVRLDLLEWSRGDVVYFRAPGDEPRSPLERLTGGPYLIKRIVAVGGDTVELRRGRLLVNGAPPDEPYLGDGPSASFDLPVTIVPHDSVFVLGDNRAPLGSRDSRVFGPVPAASVSGRAGWVVWPPLRRELDGSFSWNVRRLRIVAARCRLGRGRGHDPSSPRARTPRATRAPPRAPPRRA